MKLTHIIPACLLFSVTSLGDNEPVAEHKIQTTPETLLYVALQYTSELNVHRLNGALGNDVYTSENGHQEHVYDENDELVTDCVNKGTFNFFVPWLNPIGHFEVDISPWLRSGVCSEGGSTVQERVAAWMADFEMGLSIAYSQRHDLRTFTKVTQAELEKEELISRLCNALSSNTVSFKSLADLEKELVKDDVGVMIYSLYYSLIDEFSTPQVEAGDQPSNAS